MQNNEVPAKYHFVLKVLFKKKRTVLDGYRYSLLKYHKSLQLPYYLFL